MPFRQRMNEWSEIGMRLTTGVKNLMVVAVMGLFIFFLSKIAFALYHFIIKLAGTLPTWPAR